jgi:hypothetical protein
MKANELRIGNLIFTGDDNMVLKVQHGTIRGVLYNHLNVKPIPLTEEWLLKFGFEDSLKGWGGSQGSDYHYKKEFVEIQTYDSDNNWHLKNKFDVKFKHVHQLQNLYFALTGEELESTQIEKI